MSKELQAKKNDLILELMDVHQRAGARPLDDGEQERWNNTYRAYKKVSAEMEGNEDREERLERVKELAKNPANVISGDAPGLQTRVDSSSPVVDRARSAIDTQRCSDLVGDEGQDRLDKLVRAKDDNVNGELIAKRILITEQPAYRSAFHRLLTQRQPLLTAEEINAIRSLDAFDTEQRAMNIGTDSAGGFGVPVFIDPTIVLTGQGSPNDFYAISRVETITTDVWKGVSSAGVSWSFDAEATEVSDDSPTLAQPEVVTHKAQGFIPFSIEVQMDYPGFEQEMSKLLTEGYSELVVEKFTTGSGSGEPFGIVTNLDANTNVEIAVTTDGAFGAVDIQKVWKALPNKYRKRASWMSHVDVQGEVRNFGATFGANFTVNLTAEEITRLYGHPYYVNDFMGEFTGTTGASNLMIVGDFSNFLIAQRAGMRVEVVQHLIGTNRRPTGQRGLYAWARVGSKSVNDLGFRLLQNQ